MERDVLTGLTYYDDFRRIAGEIKEHDENKYYLISTDFSNFKYINKLYGYEKGDKVLRKFAEQFCLKQEECIAACRPYSDHILALFMWDEISDEGVRAYVSSFSEKITQELRKEFPLAGFHINYGIYPIHDRMEALASMVDKANMARRSMKINYNVSCCFYTESLMEKTDEEAKIIPIFEKNLREDTIQVYLQPKISVSRQELVGAEALARLLDEEGNVMYPMKFIPVLEKTGKIIELDYYVFYKVLALMKKWKEEGKSLFPVSVNLSQLHFYNVNLVDDILEATKKYGVEPEYIEFEVTETVFISETDLITEKLERLREYGYRVSVDDFGAGYSSLNLIGILPVDIIKLDKGFVKHSLQTGRGKEIVKGLIEILNRLDMSIICEGIEDREAEKMINDYGCDEVQGFLYDKPIPLEQFVEKYMDLDAADKRHE